MLCRVPRVQLVQQRPCHHRFRGHGLVVGEAKVAASGVVGANVEVDRVTNPRHVRRLREIVAAAASPHEHVVRQVPNQTVGVLLRRREAPPERRNVLVVPRVAVGDRCPVTNAGDLVAVVPPRHDPSVVVRVVAEPPVGLTIVIHHDHFALRVSGLVHDRWTGHLLPNVVRVAVEKQRNNDEVQHDAARAGTAVALILGVPFLHRLERLVGRRLGCAALPFLLAISARRRGCTLLFPALLGRAGPFRRGDFCRGWFVGGRFAAGLAVLEFSVHVADLAKRPLNHPHKEDRADARRHRAEQDHKSAHL
mmetsp:Transcript_22993/g.60045  ORF Transcript_22993/g.60045 Transcript_22993/m.60045 type:complete len:307 (+) Transcript_22993:500-1420(+)